MGSGKRLDLVGKCFGPLKIVARWGSVSSNVAWVYFCRACGYVGRRLGTKLVHGMVNCPNCNHAKARPGRRGWSYQAADPDEVERLMADAQPWPKRGRRAKLTVTKRLEKCSLKELTDLADKVSAAIALRIEADTIAVGQAREARSVLEQVAPDIARQLVPCGTGQCGCGGCP